MIKITNKNSWSKRTYEVIFENGNIQRFSREGQAKKFADDNKKDGEEVVIDTIKVKRRIINNRWQ